MRILTLHFKNLNSLVGEWRIDFTHPAFMNNGLFAIVGPTGAGKTTILDAICLALYGRTPRLAKISHSDNALMSQQTGECFAEVTFATLTGRYRCWWSQQRAHKKSHGKLQHPRHELSDAASDTILTYSLKTTAQQVEQLTGMDFDRFTRSMLLAQGGFAAFLHASPDERAPILEQITGSEIYSDISKKVHERYVAESRQRDELKSQLNNLHALTATDEQALLTTLTTTKQQAHSVQQQINQHQQALHWLQELDRLEHALQHLEQQHHQWQAKHQAFAHHQQRLTQANHALEIAAAYAKLNALRQEQHQEQQTQQHYLTSLPRLTAMIEQQQQAHAVHQTIYDGLKQDYLEQKRLIQQVRAIDNQLTSQQQLLTHAQQQLTNEQALAHQLELNLVNAKHNLAQRTSQLTMLVARLATQAQDEYLVEHLTGIEAYCTTVITRQQDYQEKHQAIAQLERNIKQQRQQTQQHHLALTHQQEQIDALQLTLNDYQQQIAALQPQQLQHDYQQATLALTHYNQVQTALEQTIEQLEQQHTLQQQITGFAKARQALQADHPCPLCGATTHPFTTQPLPSGNDEWSALRQARQERQQLSHLQTTTLALLTNSKTVMQKVDALTATMNKVREQQTKAQLNLAQLDSQYQAGVYALNRDQHDLTCLEQERDRLYQHYLDAVHQLTQALQPCGITLPSDFKQIAMIPSQLAQRQQRWRAYQQQRADLTQGITALTLQIEHQQYEWQRMQERISYFEQHHQTVLISCKQYQQQRYTLFGEQHPDTVEQQLINALETAAQTLDAMRQQSEQNKQERDQLINHLQTLTTRLAQRGQVLLTGEKTWQTTLNKRGFADETAFYQAQLPEDERQQLTAQARQLKEEQTAIMTRTHDTQATLQVLQAKNLTTLNQPSLIALLDNHHQKQQQLQQTIGSIEQQLQKNQTVNQHAERYRQALAQHEPQYQQWETLHALIGSADGKKFRNFAQSLTLATVIHHANHQLQKMTDRYALLPDKTHPLELNVLDNYQAGETRTTKNLSGGESFIISLSLALGLAQMVSHNVRIDSLFLDEGFGALDEEALDIALETLAKLQEDNKIIGIISHVGALKERIDTQIRVIPEREGRSIIKGPGCISA